MLPTLDTRLLCFCIAFEPILVCVVPDAGAIDIDDDDDDDDDILRHWVGLVPVIDRVLDWWLSAFGAIFFKCSMRCVVLLMRSNECRFRVMIFFSLNSATSALRVR